MSLSPSARVSMRLPTGNLPREARRRATHQSSATTLLHHNFIATSLPIRVHLAVDARATRAPHPPPYLRGGVLVYRTMDEFAAAVALCAPEDPDAVEQLAADARPRLLQEVEAGPARPCAHPGVQRRSWPLSAARSWPCKDGHHFAAKNEEHVRR